MTCCTHKPNSLAGNLAFDIECIVDGRDEVAAEEEAAGGGGWGVVLIAHSTKLT